MLCLKPIPKQVILYPSHPHYALLSNFQKAREHARQLGYKPFVIYIRCCCYYDKENAIYCQMQIALAEQLRLIGKVPTNVLALTNQETDKVYIAKLIEAYNKDLQK